MFTCNNNAYAGQDGPREGGGETRHRGRTGGARDQHSSRGQHNGTTTESQQTFLSKNTRGPRIPWAAYKKKSFRWTRESPRPGVQTQTNPKAHRQRIRRGIHHWRGIAKPLGATRERPEHLEQIQPKWSCNERRPIHHQRRRHPQRRRRCCLRCYVARGV